MFVNPLKTKLSFDLTLGSPGGGGGEAGGGQGGGRVVPAALYTAASGARFVKWCGLLINVDNLEVQGDYTR